MKRKIEKVDFPGQTREPQTPKVPEGTVADIYVYGSMEKTDPAGLI